MQRRRPEASRGSTRPAAARPSAPGRASEYASAAWCTCSMPGSSGSSSRRSPVSAPAARGAGAAPASSPVSAAANSTPASPASARTAAEPAGRLRAPPGSLERLCDEQAAQRGEEEPPGARSPAAAPRRRAGARAARTRQAPERTSRSASAVGYTMTTSAPGGPSTTSTGPPSAAPNETVWRRTRAPRAPRPSRHELRAPRLAATTAQHSSAPSRSRSATAVAAPAGKPVAGRCQRRASREKKTPSSVATAIQPAATARRSPARAAGPGPGETSEHGAARLEQEEPARRGGEQRARRSHRRGTRDRAPGPRRSRRSKAPSGGPTSTPRTSPMASVALAASKASALISPPRTGALTLRHASAGGSAASAARPPRARAGRARSQRASHFRSLPRPHAAIAEQDTCQRIPRPRWRSLRTLARARSRAGAARGRVREARGLPVVRTPD